MDQFTLVTSGVDIGQDGRPAGNRYGLRYDECLAIEAAWVYRELNSALARGA